MSGVNYVLAVRSTDLARDANRLTATRPGVLTFTAPPERQMRLPTLALAALMTLGKDPDTGTLRGAGTGLINDLRGWLASDDIADVIVLDAGVLQPAATVDFVAAMTASAIRVWFVEWEPFRPAFRKTLDAIAHTVVSEQQFRDHWFSEPAPHAKALPAWVDVDESVYPPVPYAHGIYFREECRALLRPQDHTMVDNLYRQVFADTESKLSTNKKTYDRETYRIRVAKLTWSWFNRLADPDAVVTMARAVQGAGFLHSWNIKVDETQLRGAAALKPREATRPPSSWDDLNVYVRTEIPAVCSLIGSDLSPAQIGDLALGAVNDDATTVIIQDSDDEAARTVPIHPAGQRYLRAHITRLRIGGSADTDPLICTGRKAKTAAQIARDWAEAATLDTGFNAIRRHQSRADDTNVIKAVANIGITIESFDRQVTQGDRS